MCSPLTDRPAGGSQIVEATAVPSTTIPQSPLDRTLAKMQADIEALRRANNRLAVEVSNLKENR